MHRAKPPSELRSCTPVRTALIWRIRHFLLAFLAGGVLQFHLDVTKDVNSVMFAQQLRYAPFVKEVRS
jgi:hypothetical protein